MKTKARYTLKCPECGSAECGVDAFAAWNDDTQEFELSSTYDSVTCLECEYESSNGKFWVELPDHAA